MADQPGESYLWAIPYITAPIRSIVEVGSRDGLDAIALGRTFQASVTAFECDPGMFPEVERNLALSGLKDAKALDLALTDVAGEVEFWAHDPSAYHQGGTGSLFLANFKNRDRDDVDRGRERIQKSIRVRAARFDGLGLTAPDLLMMDVQGAECKVLRGFGSMLHQVQFVICEAERVPSYTGGNPFSAVNRLLKGNGFVFRGSTIGDGSRGARWNNWWRVNARIAVRERTLIPTRIYQGVFNVIYENRRFATGKARNQL